MASNFKNLDYCESTRNIDNMLSQFRSDRSRVTSLLQSNVQTLVNNLWGSDSLVCYDSKCLFNVGTSVPSLENSFETDRLHSISNFYVCPQCRNMRRLLDCNGKDVGKPFRIEHGSLTGSELILIETEVPKLYNVFSNKEIIYKIISSSFYNQLRNCSDTCTTSVDYGDIDYLGSDPFSNNLLINWYINDYLENLGINNVIKMYTGFVCGRKGYSLYEYPNIGRLRHLQDYPQYLSSTNRPSPTAKADDKDPLAVETARGIVFQLYAVLHALSMIDFSHGGPSSRSILFKDEPCSYIYDGTHVESPITLKLCDLYYSGITIGNTRLYNKSVIADEQIRRKPFKPIIDINGSTYKLNDPTKNLTETILFMYIKHLGLPIYQSSFDLYGFMVTLMSDRSFYATVMSDEGLYELWKGMWDPSEFDIIQAKMLKLHDSPDPMTRVDKVLRTLAGFNLKCEVLNLGWNYIKTLF